MREKLSDIMEKAFEKFLETQGMPCMGKLTRLVCTIGMENKWEEWLAKRGIVVHRGVVPKNMVCCHNPMDPADWPYGLQMSDETAMKILTLGEVP